MAFLPAEKLTIRPNVPKRRRTRLLTEPISAGAESFAFILVSTTNGHYESGMTSRRQFPLGTRTISFEFRCRLQPNSDGNLSPTWAWTVTAGGVCSFGGFAEPDFQPLPKPRVAPRLAVLECPVPVWFGKQMKQRR